MTDIRYTAVQSWGTDFVTTAVAGTAFINLNERVADEVTLIIPASGSKLDVLCAGQVADPTKFVTIDAPSGFVIPLSGNNRSVHLAEIPPIIPMNNLLSKRTQTVYAPGGGGGVPGSQSVDGGVATIAQNDVSKAVTFGATFTSAPAVMAQILLPNNSSSGIEVWPDESTRTASGVTFLFNAAIPAAGYKLSWQAVGS